MLAVPVGLLASAILVVNNVRDLETDRRAGKRTLAVRLGRARARSAVRGDGLRRVPLRAAAVAARARRRAVGVAAARRCSRCRWPCRSCGSCATRSDGPSLNGALARTGMLEVAFCSLLSAGILAS